MRGLILAILAMLTAAPAVAQTGEEQRQLDWVVERGQLLFALDRAAWVATDDLFAHTSEAQRVGLRAYVVDRDAQGLFVTFFARENDRAVAGYRGRVGAGGIVSREVFAPGQRPALTARQARMARALESVIGGIIRSCSSQTPNIAVVPPLTDDDAIDVYITDPQMKEGAVQFGGHQRITFDASGREIARRAFTRSCIEVGRASPGPSETLVGITITHLLDPIPTEVHVFISLALGLPVFVGTDDPVRIWSVTGDGIRLAPDVAAE